MTWHELLSLTPELKELRMFLQSVPITLQRTSVKKKTEKLTNYNSDGEIFMTQSVLLK